MYEMYHLEDHLVKMVPKFERICPHILKKFNSETDRYPEMLDYKLIISTGVYMLRHSVMSDSL